MKIHDGIQPLAEIVILEPHITSEDPSLGIGQLPVSAVFDPILKLPKSIEHFRDDVRELSPGSTMLLPKQRTVQNNIQERFHLVLKCWPAVLPLGLAHHSDRQILPGSLTTQ